MNGKFEEKLAMLAFGDISPEEARELERKAASHPEAQKALDQYRAMRAELRNLGEAVPPDQLSKERLRDAILGQGLKPKPVANESRNWFWMPILAGAAAFSIFWFRPTQTVEPQLVLDGSSVASLEKEAVKPLVSTQPTVIKPIPVKKLVVSNDAKPKPERRRRRPEPIVIESAEYAENNEFMVDSGPMPMDVPKEKTAREDVKSALVASSTNEAHNSGPIILIDTHKDAATGASGATEVGTASNVLVGG